jgi:hypothetical protein
MINVNKITSTLAKLEDPELQQYAQMHKNDPYIMALAMSESNRRKELRAASQESMQEQPKVVDQMVAEMAPQQMPEDQGIGQLPAGDMNFAGGGIIAFADGGDVERYQFGGNTMGGFTPDFAQAELAGSASALQTQETQRARTLAELEQKVAFLTNAGAPQAAAARAQLEAFKASGQSALPAAQFTPAAVSPAAPVAAGTEGRRTSPVAEGAGTNVSPNLIPASARTKAKIDAPPAAPGTKPAAPSAPPAPSGQTQSSEAGIEALQKKYFDPLDQEIGGLRNARVGLASGIADLANKNLAATKADIEKRGDVYKGREERLTKQEKGLEGTSDKYMGLALLQAGAAIMTTPGGISMALGKGIDVGSRQYAVGMEKINAAKEKFAEARDRLDDLRINRDDMNAKDIRAAEKEVREAQLKGQELFYNGLVSDLGIKQKNVTAIFGAAADDLKTTRQIEAERANTLTRERGATARANAFTPDMREAMLLGTGTTPEEKYLSGLKVKKDLMGDKQGTQLFKMFLEENGRREKNMEQPLTLDQFRRQSAAFFAPPAPVDTGKPTRP